MKSISKLIVSVIVFQVFCRFEIFQNFKHTMLGTKRIELDETRLAHCWKLLMLEMSTMRVSYVLSLITLCLKFALIKFF